MASSPRIDELRKKFEENPRRYFAPLANEYRKAGEIDQAIAICREYLPQQPGHMSGHIVYGQALYEARQFEEGKTVFETALTLDPENLIALRHLGDIALIVGDAEGARGWYRRVLDADPRNEEIQAQLARLDTTPGAAAPAATASAPEPSAPAAPAAALPAAGTKPTPSTAPTVVMSAIPRPGAAATSSPDVAPVPAAAPVTAQSPTAEIRLDTIATNAPPAAAPPVEMALGLEPTSFGGNEPSAPPMQPLDIDSPVSSRQQAPAPDSFSLEGLETTSLAAEPAATPAPEPAAEGATLDLYIPPAISSEGPPAPPVAAGVQDTPNLVDLEFAPPAPPAPAVPPSTPPDAPASPPLDLDFAVASANTAAAEPPTPAAAPAAGDLALLDLGEMPSAPSAASAAASVPAMEALIEAPMEAQQASESPPIAEFELPSVPAEAPLPVAETAQPVSQTGPFVTETMAELYLQQGHRDEALRVYRALLEQRPDDASLRAKVAGLSPAPVHTGPTIRELLNLIALRRPGFRPEPPRGNGSNGASPAALAPSALAADGLALLFAGAPVSADDDAAAMSLAMAFIDFNGHEIGVADEAAIAGAPAHRAAGDLTLDTVFGAPALTEPAPAGFSFDQFFSQRATAEHAAESGAGGSAGAESPEDVAHFTQWLEGLKQK